MSDENNKLDALLKTYPTNVRDIAMEARKVILASIPDVQEMVDRPDRVIGYGFGTGYGDLICTIILSKKGAKLGIVGGADLPDPNGLLEGTGRRHRYIALANVSDLKKPGLKGLLKAGLAAWEQRSKGR
jgi:hypothetical protein